MNKQFIQNCLQKATYERKPNTNTSYIWDSGFTFLPKTISIFRGSNNVKCAKKGRNLQNVEAQLKGTFSKKEESHLKQFAPYRVSTQIWEIENYPSFIGYGSIGITGESGTITKESDTGDLIILYSKDYNWDKIEIFYFKGMLPFRVSRNFVGIIFYTRKVLLTSHYEKRLFEHASQPRVAGSDIRLLSYLWS